MTEILGQTRALEILDHALRSGRFHHAWIFSGPRGVGKFTTAVQVARVLLDPELRSRGLPGEQEIQSPTSKVQNLIDSGTHPDLHIIRKELAAYSDDRLLRERKQLNIPIDLLRERIIGDAEHEAPAYRTSLLNHGKVFIIDEAELLDPTGQNAMLKTLEEPPGDTHFFLVTSQPDRLLPTIRSRSQHVRFGRLDESAMREWFKHAAKDHESLRTASAREWVQEFADGAPGAALLALEYSFESWQRTLDPMLEDLEHGKFPAKMGETLAALVDEFAVAWVKKHGERTTSKDAANKDGARHMFSLLSSHARNKLAAAVEREAVGGYPWLSAIDVIREAERQLDSNVNMKLLMENLVVQWAQANSMAA
jgi:DNA polymerase III subunit delta'